MLVDLQTQLFGNRGGQVRASQALLSHTPPLARGVLLMGKGQQRGQTGLCTQGREVAHAAPTKQEQFMWDSQSMSQGEKKTTLPQLLTITLEINPAEQQG